MAQPRDYTRQYNFGDFQTTNPNDPLPGTQVDAELNTVKLTLDDLNTNIGLIQRDDGKLGNLVVHKDAFDAGALAMINSNFTPRGDWAAARSYAVGDIVDFNSATYLATEAHTSATAFAADDTANRWMLIANAALSGASTNVDKFEGDGQTTVFNLSYSYTSETAIQVFVNGGLLNPVDDYTLSGNTLTLYTAPGVPAVSGNENLIVWGPSVRAQAALDAAEASASNASGYADESEAWASRTTGLVENTDYSSKAYATGGTGVDTSAGSAKDWATKTSGTVGNTSEYSSKYWATQGNVPIVAQNISDVNTVAGDITNVNTTATNISDVNTVAGSITNVNTVGNDITNVNTTAGSISNVNTVSTNIADVNTLADIENGTVATNALSDLAAIQAAITAVNNNSTNVNTVSGSISNVNTVAGDITNVNTVATDITNVNTTATNVADVNTVAGSITNVNAVGTNISNVNTVAGIDANVTTVAGISSDVTTVSNVQANVTTVAGSITNVNTVASDVTNVNTVAGDISNVNTTATNIADVNTVAGQIGTNGVVTIVANAITDVSTVSGDIASVITAANDLNEAVSEIDTVANSITNVDTVGANISDVNTVAGISSNVTAVASDAADIGTVAGSITNVNTVAGISSDVTAVSGISADVSAVAGDATDIGTVANAISDVSAVATSITNVDTVATNIDNVNDFFDVYRVGATDPTADNDGGDLFYNTTSGVLKVYNASTSSWEQGVTAGSGFLPLSGGTLTGNLTFASTQTFDGRDLSVDGAKLDGIEANATADQTKSDIDALGIDASTAATLATARNIALTGDVTGSASFNGGADISITATIADDSHNHTIANVDGLQTALNGKLSTTGKAADSELLDGVNGASYLRSDTADTASNLTINTLAIGSSNQIKFANNDYILYDDADGVGAFKFNVDAGTENAKLKAGEVHAAADMYVGNKVIHVGDTDTYTQFDAANQWRVVTGGTERVQVTNNGIGIGNTAPGNTFANGKAIAIGDSDTGIRQNGDGVLELWANNQECIDINTTRAYFYKNIDMGGRNVVEVEDIGLRDRIYHDDDTDTYIQFHAGNQWRVVTGGAERFEVNNTRCTMAQDLTVNGGDIILGGTGRIQGVDTVSSGTDAANKNYVDTAVGNAASMASMYTYI